MMGNKPDPWAWVKPFIRDAAESKSKTNECVLAGEVDVCMDQLLYLLRNYTAAFWSIDEPGDSCVLWTNDDQQRRPNMNAPLLAFNPAALREALIGHDLTAAQYLAEMDAATALPIRDWGTPLYWARLGAKQKGDLSETIYRLLCVATEIYTVPVKTYSNNGLDGFSIIPRNGNITFASTDAKNEGKGWINPDVCTVDGALLRIKEYFNYIGNADCKPRLSWRAELLLKFAAVCMASWPQRDDLPIHWRFVGGLTWPNHGGDGGMIVRATYETIPDHPFSQRLKQYHPEVLMSFPLREAMLTLKFLLEVIAEAESRQEQGFAGLLYIIGEEEGLPSIDAQITINHMRRLRSTMLELILSPQGFGKKKPQLALS